MKLDKISQNLLEQIALLHDIPEGAVSFRINGKSEFMRSTEHIVIEKKFDKSGINIFVSSACQNEACHIPVIVTENELFDLAYNDFYIEDNANVTIVAGCGVHSTGEGGHNGIHTFHIGKNAVVNYYENHLATGDGKKKDLNPTTILKIGAGSIVNLFTNQIGGVSASNRITKAVLNSNSTLNVVEKIRTDKFEVSKSQFRVELKGENSKCNINSKSVAMGESEQTFKSDLVGKNLCFGHVECDGIVLDGARVVSEPKVEAWSNLASLSHEASIGKIADDQILKLRTLGLNQKQAEEKIIEGFLK